MVRKALLLALLAATGMAEAQVQTDVSKLQIRVGRPLITRGPQSNMLLDSPLAAIQLNNGAFRVFSAGGSSYRFEGTDSWGASSTTPHLVIGPVGGTLGSCGFWLNDMSRMSGSTTAYYGYAHAETACNYQNGGQTHKSTGLFISYDEGASWAFSGQILSGYDVPTAGRQSGEGDCTAVTDNAHVYLYCLRTDDFTMIAARAPKDNPGPGNWYKFKDGAWSQPGLGGGATPAKWENGYNISFGSASVSKWASKGYVTLVNNDSTSAYAPAGVQIGFSSDYHTFYRPKQPLLVTDGANWARPAESDLIAYPSAIAVSGGREWDGGFLLTYTFLEPGEDFNRRFLVFREVNMSFGNPSNGATPQVGVELSKWVNDWSYPAGIRTTTAPVQGNYSSYAYSGGLGYVMTAPLQGPGAPATVALEECVSFWPGNADHLVTYSGTCVGSGYRRLRTIGWIYSAQQPGTIPLYRCWSPNYYRSHYVSNDPSCEGRGEQEFPLGWVLAS